MNRSQILGMMVACFTEARAALVDTAKQIGNGEITLDTLQRSADAWLVRAMVDGRGDAIPFVAAALVVESQARGFALDTSLPEEPSRIGSIIVDAPDLPPPSGLVS